ncbi:hypothetical protein [Mesorhizobium sp.]|uniref:hypothetical protein n=1 Tax=Mesorhizobium sp. TaxID=1871066 RepID=UPI000FE7E822|nr:hypothetical protein [Mesorhizobium sp.]RWO20629.1 MAG: hypothetical protein EOS09_26265 [Mesorhizobium sp.]
MNTPLCDYVYAAVSSLKGLASAKLLKQAIGRVFVIDWFIEPAFALDPFRHNDIVGLDLKMVEYLCFIARALRPEFVSVGVHA